MTKHSIRTGLSFGLTSGIITTLGLIIGLHSGTKSKLVIIGGILTIAIADAFSDALGIHISEESKRYFGKNEVWESTISTLFFKSIFSLMFIVPVLIFELSAAILISVLWGLFLLAVFSFIIAREQNENPLKVISEHIIIALLVITITHLIGDWVSVRFS